MNQPMVPIALNMDIMLSIVSFSPPKTATSIMETCRFLYHEGAKVVLQQPIFLRHDGSEQKLLALLRFIQAEDLSRCSYIRNLSISVYPYMRPEAVAIALVDIVPSMSNLMRLCLRVEHLLQAFPYLLPVFASLRSVKTLIVEEAGEISCELVMMFQSKLVTAHILWASYYSSTSINRLFHLLRHSASTLEEIGCSGFRSDAVSMEIESPTSPSQIIYPKVHTLILHATGDAPCPLPYIKAFPNLVHFRVEGNYVNPSQNQAQTNLILQRPVEDPLEGGHIQTYTGSLFNLWALRITFPIPRLYITTTGPSEQPALQLTKVLAYARPIHLIVAFQDEQFAQSLSSALLRGLQSEGASGLQSLEFTVDLMAADVDGRFDVGRFWTSIEAICLCLPLHNLHLVMHDISIPDRDTASLAAIPSPAERASAYARAATFDVTPESFQCFDSPSSQKVHWTSFTLAERTLEDFDVRAFLGRLSASIPTLRNASVSIARPSRWGGGIRTARWYEPHGETSGMQADTRDDVLYEELEQNVRRLWQTNEEKYRASLARGFYYGFRGWSIQWSLTRY